MSRTELHNTLATLRQVQETRIDVSARGGSRRVVGVERRKAQFLREPFLCNHLFRRLMAQRGQIRRCRAPNALGPTRDHVPHRISVREAAHVKRVRRLPSRHSMKAGQFVHSHIWSTLR